MPPSRASLAPTKARPPSALWEQSLLAIASSATPQNRGASIAGKPCSYTYGTGAGSGSLVTRNKPHNPEMFP
ncbi:hypothetical protein DKY63_30100 [Pseudomonas putida]|uniref:Uncharacterized protein n=1 Tax=Pseudomonas putida TaxID=303 RepID=A0A2Z4RRY5_PSEPU|nr:hypothetical protein DKY63_30100 [Pseudomonas putida]